MQENGTTEQNHLTHFHLIKRNFGVARRSLSKNLIIMCSTDSEFRLCMCEQRGEQAKEFAEGIN